MLGLLFLACGIAQPPFGYNDEGHGRYNNHGRIQCHTRRIYLPYHKFSIDDGDIEEEHDAPEIEGGVEEVPGDKGTALAPVKDPGHPH